MPEAFVVHSVVDVAAAVGGVVVCFGVACAYVRRRLDRDRRTVPTRTVMTARTGAGYLPEDLGPRRPFRLPASAKGVAPAPFTARAPFTGRGPFTAQAPFTATATRPDWPASFAPFGTGELPVGKLASAHLYELVSRDYLTETTSMPPVQDPAPARPFIAPLPRRSPRGRANWVRSDWDRPASAWPDPNNAKQNRGTTGWFGETEACG